MSRSQQLTGHFSGSRLSGTLPDGKGNIGAATSSVLTELLYNMDLAYIYFYLVSFGFLGQELSILLRLA